MIKNILKKSKGDALRHFSKSDETNYVIFFVVFEEKSDVVYHFFEDIFVVGEDDLI